MSNKVKYGDPHLMPSFWLDHEWSWTNLKRNFSNVLKENYTGPGELTDFLTRLIENCLASKGKDPELYIKKIVDEKSLNRKMKMRGIKSCTYEKTSEEVDGMVDNFDTNVKHEDINEYKIMVPVGDIKIEETDIPDEFSNANDDETINEILTQYDYQVLYDTTALIARPSVIKTVGRR